MEEDPPMFYDRGKGGNWCDRIILNNKLRFAVVMFLMAVVIPLLIYVYIFVDKSGDNSLTASDVWGKCVLKPEYRVPCITGRRGLTSTSCGAVGCCWNTTTSECHHSLPSKYEYLAKSRPEVNNILSFDLTPRTPYTPFDVQALTMKKTLECTIRAVSAERLQIKIRETPDLEDVTGVPLDSSQFNVTEYMSGFSIEVRRHGDDATMLLSTARGPLIASDNYWEITLQLPSTGHVYGLGRVQLRDGVENPRVFHVNANNTASYPVVMALDVDGLAHGVYVDNTGPMETLFYRDSNLLVIRALSNQGFDVNVFAGPTPVDVMRQYTDMVGRPKMPPYWALGLHVCQDYQTDVGLNFTRLKDDFERFVKSSEAFGLPYDTHCLNERLLDDLTYEIQDGEVLAWVQERVGWLRDQGRHFLMSLPVQVYNSSDNLAFTSAAAENMFVSVPSSPRRDDIFLMNRLTQTNFEVGEYAGLPVAYPDWTHPAAQSWLEDRVTGLQQQLNVSGFVLQDNWPANQMQAGNKEDMTYLPEVFNDYMSNGTLWWKSLHTNEVLHNEIHNVYGVQHAAAMSEILPTSDSLLLTSAAAPGSGHWAGSHQHKMKDLPVKWSSLKEVLISALGSGLVGTPLSSGGSVCGAKEDFNETLHEAVCLKWYLLSVTLPLIRTSSVLPYRDPSSLVSGFTRNAILRALRFRYTLLPYFYTVFKESADTGIPVARPMFFEFPGDNNTHHLDEQFMLGGALMMVPVLEPYALNVRVYLPNGTSWYNLMSGTQVHNGTGGYIVTVPTLETEITALLKGGTIVPTQTPGMTATASRLNPYRIMIALNEGEAKGQLYLEEDVFLNLIADMKSLTLSNMLEVKRVTCYDGSPHGTLIDRINVYGPEQIVLRLADLKIDWCKEPDQDQLTVQY